jgi:hypothetical protein
MSITYPVDVENTRWSLVRVSTNQIERHNKPWPNRHGTEIPGLDPDLVPLLEVQEAKPAFDPATHKLQRTPGVIDIPNNTHTHGWQIIALTQEELDEQADIDQARQAYQGLINGTGDTTQRLQRVERVAAHLLKLNYGPQA